VIDGLAAGETKKFTVDDSLTDRVVTADYFKQVVEATSPTTRRRCGHTCHLLTRKPLDMRRPRPAGLRRSHHYAVASHAWEPGALDAQRGDLASAERGLRRALAIKERSLGKDHLELAAALRTLGVVRRRQGDAIEAEQLSGRALAMYDTGGLEHHQHVTVLQANLDRAASATQQIPPERTPAVDRPAREIQAEGEGFEPSGPSARRLSR
jgi:hypothetical protein